VTAHLNDRRGYAGLIREAQAVRDDRVVHGALLGVPAAGRTWLCGGAPGDDLAAVSER